jgi:hypothetical protein
MSLCKLLCHKAVARHHATACSSVLRQPTPHPHLTPIRHEPVHAVAAGEWLPKLQGSERDRLWSLIVNTFMRCPAWYALSALLGSAVAHASHEKQPSRQPHLSRQCASQHDSSSSGGGGGSNISSGSWSAPPPVASVFAPSGQSLTSTVYDLQSIYILDAASVQLDRPGLCTQHKRSSSGRTTGWD